MILPFAGHITMRYFSILGMLKYSWATNYLFPGTAACQGGMVEKRTQLGRIRRGKRGIGSVYGFQILLGYYSYMMFHYHSDNSGPALAIDCNHPASNNNCK